jgi:hypothetical protein
VSKYWDQLVDFLESLPPWGLKALALAVGLFLAILAGLFIKRLFGKLEGHLPSD